MAVQNSLVKGKGQQRLGLTAYLTADAVKQQINNVVGGKDGQRFISAIVSAVNTNSDLQECTNQSILSGALLGESLKLSPSPQLGHYYLVPFNDKEKGKVAQFQLGYKGYIQLAIRSGQYRKLNVIYHCCMGSNEKRSICCVGCYQKYHQHSMECDCFVPQANIGRYQEYHFNCMERHKINSVYSVKCDIINSFKGMECDRFVYEADTGWY